MAAAGRSDVFEHRYAAPLLEPAPVDGLLREREARQGQARQGQARAAPGHPFALQGCVLTPDQAVEPGWVLVAGDIIAELRDTPPADVRVVETGGMVVPGLIDLHGHPEYNVFAAREPPRVYANHYQWRRSHEYAAVAREPWRLLADATPERPSLLRTLTRYAEARALVDGVTAIQGASGRYPRRT